MPWNVHKVTWGEVTHPHSNVFAVASTCTSRSWPWRHPGWNSSCWCQQSQRQCRTEEIKGLGSHSHAGVRSILCGKGTENFSASPCSPQQIQAQNRTCHSFFHPSNTFLINFQLALCFICCHYKLPGPSSLTCYVTL